MAMNRYNGAARSPVSAGRRNDVEWRRRRNSDGVRAGWIAHSLLPLGPFGPERG